MAKTCNIDRESGAALAAHYKEIADLHLRDMFADDASRCQGFTLEACDVLLDYSKNRIVPATIELLLALAEESGIAAWRSRLFAGETVNSSEGQAATHVAFRAATDLEHSPYRETLERMREFSTSLRTGRWLGASGQPIRSVVCLGIGGSHLGSAMACYAIDAGDSQVEVHFVPTAAAGEMQRCLQHLQASETLFVISSKSFANWETCDNSKLALEWLACDGISARQHCIAISANRDAANTLGIDPEHCLEIEETVGGRYSLCSAVGLPFAIHAGMDAFENLLRGAQAMDVHFCEATERNNMPLILALLDIWYSNFFATRSSAVLSYIERLAYFPRYLQQLEMESNGKSVSRDGQALNHTTASVLWGGLALEGQHSVNQLLHQGTHFVPIDFIISARQGGDDDRLWSNFLAQSHLLMHGKEDTDSHKQHRGNRPSNSIVLKELTPGTLGQLIALYEHRTFCKAVIWGINPFDQWGVVAGKSLAHTLYQKLQDQQAIDTLDSSSQALAQRYSKWRK